MAAALAPHGGGFGLVVESDEPGGNRISAIHATFSGILSKYMRKLMPIPPDSAKAFVGQMITGEIPSPGPAAY